MSDANKKETCHLCGRETCKLGVWVGYNYVKEDTRPCDCVGCGYRPPLKKGDE